MSTEKQLEANRQNAEKSTGPKTAEGKVVAKLNAVRHGLLSKELLVPREDKGALQEFSNRLREELRPQGALEELLMVRIVAAAWRLQRILRFERELFKADLEESQRLWARFNLDEKPKPTLGEAVSEKTYDKIIRYEAHIERTLYRAMHQLERVQRSRSGEVVPPPLVLDEA